MLSRDCVLHFAALMCLAKRLKWIETRRGLVLLGGGLFRKLKKMKESTKDLGVISVL